jgi:hypothetical protein
LRPAKRASDGAPPEHGNALLFIAITVDPDEGILVERGDPHCAFRVQTNAVRILEAAKPATEREPAVRLDFILGKAFAIGTTWPPKMARTAPAASSNHHGRIDRRACGDVADRRALIALALKCRNDMNSSNIELRTSERLGQSDLN